MTHYRLGTTSCPACQAAAERDMHFTARLNAQGKTIDALSGRCDLLDQAEDSQNATIREMAARIVTWEDAHNRLVVYAESLEARLSALARRVAELETPGLTCRGCGRDL